MTELETAIELLRQYAIPVIAIALGTSWIKSKVKLSQLRKFIDSVDDAVQDNTVSETEFQTIYRTAKDLIS